MCRIGGVGQITAGQLVLTLCTGLNALEPVRDRIVNCLIVTQLKVQKGVVLDRAPIPAIQRISANEIYRARNPPSAAALHYHQNTTAHFLAYDGEEITGQIGTAPFPRAGFHVEGEEGVPDRFRQIGTREPTNLDTGTQGLLAFPPD